LPKTFRKYTNYIVLLYFCSFLNCEKEHYVLEDFKSIKKIDAHIHFNTENPAFVKQAIEDNFHLLPGEKRIIKLIEPDLTLREFRINFYLKSLYDS